MGSVSYKHPSVMRPLYSFAEADRLAGVSPGTSRRWLKGYHYWYSPEERRTSPPLTPHPEPEEGVSFVDLVEVVVAGRLRARGFSLKRIRQINEYCQLALQKKRPLVTETFRTSGRDVFIMAGNGYLLNVLYQAGMQAWDEVLDPFLKDMDYEKEVARRWWLLGREHEVVVDPDYGFGLPVVARSGVRTEIIAERVRAGDSKDEISYDLDVTPKQIKDALRLEMPKKVA
jgi:uncharacterized protein (DUF433 family)